jgi:hypothetical protein
VINGNVLKINIQGPNTVEIFGSKEFATSISQILAWIGAAFRVSETAEVQYSEALITQTSLESFAIDFVQTPLVEAEKICWLPLFYNPVIAKGFPIPKRDNQELGIEIPVSMMTALSGAEDAVEYGVGLILKGFSNMLVPVKRQRSSVQWHLVSNMDGRRMKYSEVKKRCPKRLSLDEFGHDELFKTRAFLAWWKASESYLGTSAIRYEDFSCSTAKRASKTVKLTDVSVGFQNWGTVNINFSIGQKDSPRRISRAGRLEVILDAADQMHVFLRDFGSKRNWLVSGTELLLHLVHMKHRKKPYLIAGTRTDLTYAEPSCDGPTSCRKALLKIASMPLYSDKTVANDDFCVKHLVSKLWSHLEIIEAEEEENGIAIRLPANTLKGYEMMDLILDKGILRKRETTLISTNGGWLDLVKACDCSVVLFGSHFGELIRPVAGSGSLCSPWMKLPKDKDYLATTASKISQIFGNNDDQGHLVLFDVRVHKASLLFEDCQGSPNRICNCIRVQQIITKYILQLKAIIPPGPLPAASCVIIGQARRVLRSSKPQNGPAIFNLPNTQLMPMLKVPENVAGNSSESDTDDSIYSSTSSRMEITPSTPISEDPSQNGESVLLPTSGEIVDHDVEMETWDHMDTLKYLESNSTNRTKKSQCFLQKSHADPTAMDGIKFDDEYPPLGINKTFQSFSNAKAPLQSPQTSANTTETEEPNRYDEFSAQCLKLRRTLRRSTRSITKEEGKFG